MLPNQKNVQNFGPLSIWFVKCVYQSFILLSYFVSWLFIWLTMIVRFYGLYVFGYLLFCSYVCVFICAILSIFRPIKNVEKQFICNFFFSKVISEEEIWKVYWGTSKKWENLKKSWIENFPRNDIFFMFKNIFCQIN